MRVMTDVSAARYWTVVSETEVESLEKFAELTRKLQMKEFQKAAGTGETARPGRGMHYTITVNE